MMLHKYEYACKEYRHSRYILMLLVAFDSTSAACPFGISAPWLSKYALICFSVLRSDGQEAKTQ